MSNNSNNVHFSGERLICNPHLIIIVPRFARADNDKIRAANESSAFKMNIIVILKTGNRRNRNQKRRVYDFVTSWDPMFPNIGKAIKKFAKILKKDEDCREVFPEGCFRVGYERGHKNLKEIIAPSSFAFASHGDVRQRNHRD